MSERIAKIQFDQMLEEVAGYSVELESDPTLPHLGTKYLQTVLSKCRSYINRSLFYLQAMMREEKEIKRDIKQRELDLEFKMNEKLADDSLVRAQPSIDDRKAVAATLLKVEHEELAQLRVDLIDVQETVKILRMKYQDLQRTSNDIKLQRTIVKDDRETQLGGGTGYSPPQTNQDGSIPGGLPAPIKTKPIDPKDILDPNKRPADLPEPKSESDAGLIAAFLSRHPEKTEKTYTGRRCSVCKKPQFNTQNGVVCELGHDAPPLEEEEEQKTIPKSSPIAFDDTPISSIVDYESLLK